MDWLGLPSSVSVSGFGAVQGRAAELRYGRYPSAKFTWRYEDSPAIEHGMQGEQVISLVSVSEYYGDDFSLLYVETDPPESTTTAENARFKTLMITRPPMDLIKDFVPSGQSCWSLRSDLHEKSTGGKPSLDVIVSTKSGHGHGEKLYENVLKPFLAHVGCIHTLHTTTSTESVNELCRDIFLPAANGGEMKMIIMLSGDGGIVDLINGLLPPRPSENQPSTAPKIKEGFVKPSITLLPVGTGNALAHSSGLTGDRTMGMASLVRGYPQDLPLFTVRFTPPARVVLPLTDESRNVNAPQLGETVGEAHGAVVFSWALHASLVADSDTPAYRTHGPERFQIAAKENLFPANGGQTHAYRGRLSLKRAVNGAWEEVPRDTHGYVLATLCSRLEEKFTISPATKPLDGKLRVVHFGAMAGSEAVRLMQMGYDGGKHVEDPIVGYKEIDAMRLEMDEADDSNVDEAHGGPSRWRRVCIDGKIYLCQPRTMVEVSSPRHSPSSIKFVRGQA